MTDSEISLRFIYWESLNQEDPCQIALFSTVLDLQIQDLDRTRGAIIELQAYFSNSIWDRSVYACTQVGQGNAVTFLLL